MVEQKKGAIMAITDSKTLNTKLGDKVRATGYTQNGTVVKVKPDGSKVVRTQFGTLKTMKNPKKPVTNDLKR